MNSTSSNEPIHVITSVQRRRRWSSKEKEEIVRETMEPGNSVSLVARKYNVAPKSALPMEAFYGEWCKPRNRERRESNSRIRSLERLLGRKTEENEILKEAVVLARKKKLISQKPLEGIEGFQ